MPTGLPEGSTDADREWVLDFCGIRSAWSKSRGAGIVIAHPDTGYTDHPELMKGGRILAESGLNLMDGPGKPPVDPLIGMIPFAWPSHGTGTASVIMSGEGHPFRGQPPDAELEDRYLYPYTEADWVSGVAPEARLIPYRITSSVILNDYTASNLAAAIFHAASLRSAEPPLDVAVMSISLGRPRLSLEHNVQTAVQWAREQGIVICAAAGQLDGPSRGGRPGYPGSDENTICVAACTYDHAELAPGFYGPEVDITAPGVNVWRAFTEMIPPYRYTVSPSTGTSHATAIVAGACALWQSYHGREALIARYGRPLLTDAFRKALRDSCHTPSGWDTARRGAGVLDVDALLATPLSGLASRTDLQDWIRDGRP